jgi:hypothetical protein
MLKLVQTFTDDESQRCEIAGLHKCWPDTAFVWVHLGGGYVVTRVYRRVDIERWVNERS